MLNLALVSDDDTARDWAVSELSKVKYHQTESVLQQLRKLLWKWFGKPLENFDLGESWLGIAIVALGICTLISLILFLVRKNLHHRNPVRKKHTDNCLDVPLFDDDRNSAQLFQSANQALAAGNLNLAVIDKFRGIIRYLSETQQIILIPGMTATEAGHLTAQLIPTPSLATSSAEHFNRVYYGEENASSHSYAILSEMQEQVLARKSYPSKRQDNSASPLQLSDPSNPQLAVQVVHTNGR